MPLIFKLLGYGGNGVLFLFGLLALTEAKSFWPGVFMAVLGGVNLYVIRKIDLYSREEAWLESELHKRELRQKIAEFDRQAAGEGNEAGGAAEEPKRIGHGGDTERPRN
jgi:hypothetical protein